MRISSASERPSPSKSAPLERPSRVAQRRVVAGQLVNAMEAPFAAAATAAPEAGHANGA